MNDNTRQSVIDEILKFLINEKKEYILTIELPKKKPRTQPTHDKLV